MSKIILDKKLYIDRENFDFEARCRTLAKIIRKKAINSPFCIEIDEYFKSILIKNGFIVFENIKDTKDQYDFIYSSNVLEHIFDDINSLQQLESKLTKNGKLVLYLPAFQILFSDLDRSVGHFRRYSKRRILKITSLTGFRVDKMFYVDSLGFFCSFIIQILGWNTKFGVGSKNSLKLYDKFIFPISKFLDSLGFKYILGKNIFVCLKKHDNK